MSTSEVLPQAVPGPLPVAVVVPASAPRTAVQWPRGVYAIWKAPKLGCTPFGIDDSGGGTLKKIARLASPLAAGGVPNTVEDGTTPLGCDHRVMKSGAP